ncbi:MAG: hypothetical protein CVU97_02685 [Firmicutes bacterium HGW-Firmicutes-21]|nr:MAG: hypothetical protein CVU97_02685 [Firmicutes bacterium HGW-Firmicutes-21]
MNIYAVLLCAGEGTRMNDNRTHKVCYEIAGVPAVIRQINNLREAGVNRFIVVVGSKADKVMETLDGIDGVVFAYQPKQLGTGNAALHGFKALHSVGYSGPAIVAMGDKIISPDVYTGLIERYKSSASRVAFAVQPKEFNHSGGRAVISGDNACGIVEHTDSFLFLLGETTPRTRESYISALKSSKLNNKKQEMLVEKALSMSDRVPSSISLCGRKYNNKDIESNRYVNAATYIFDVDSAIGALESAGSNNAQNEVYLTDAVNKLIAEDGGTSIYPVEDAKKILTYSTMDELLMLQKYFTVPTPVKNLLTAGEWLGIFKDSTAIKDTLSGIYGSDDAYLIDRISTYINVLERFIKRYGDKAVVIVRAPGRVNLMGRHIEHRGGSINVMSINRETIAVVSPRVDDTVVISNTDNKFTDFEFSILDIISRYDTTDWLDFIESESISKIICDNKGEWVNYIKSSVLRLQLKNRDKLLCGMEMMFTGNIPVAAGLSSSSSLVVATAEAVVSLNGLTLEDKDFISLCGEGEWFVGSRGGSGDHAAMKSGRRDKLTHLNFFPFTCGESVEFPSECRIIVANSYIEAKKSAGAKDIFNQRVACYEFGFMMIKKQFPQYKERLNYLRDINPKRLDVPPSRIYEMLLTLPERATSDEIKKALPEYEKDINRIQKSHAIPEYYDIRSVMLYGIAECMRADKCMDMLKAKDFASLGGLMNISHDGDRVLSGEKEYDYSAGDEYLLRLISDLKSEDLERVTSAQIYNQPGGYACSTPEIDRLIDMVKAQDGVFGAQLSGAGLGGCIIILVKSEKADDILKKLKNDYYDKNALQMGAQLFIPVAGSLVLATPAMVTAGVS